MNAEKSMQVKNAEQKLAIASVEFQGSNSPTYDAENSLAQGTLFPTLNLPFRLAINGTAVPVTPLTELQALGFVLVELNLYLDTHPNDKEAFAMFQKYAALEEEGRKLYEAKYGPLTSAASASQGQYTWTHGPWPWEKEAN